MPYIFNCYSSHRNSNKQSNTIFNYENYLKNIKENHVKSSLFAVNVKKSKKQRIKPIWSRFIIDLS